MNIVVFVPIGILLGCSFRIMNWKLCILTGCMLAVCIEFFQFVLKRGFTEFDDVMHNTLGCMIGYGLYSMIRFGYEWIHKKRVAVLQVFVLAKMGKQGEHELLELNEYDYR